MEENIQNQYDHFLEVSDDMDNIGDGWDLFISKEEDEVNFKVWRRRAEGGLFAYKTWAKIPHYEPEFLVNLQRDLDFRRNYIEHTPELRIIESNDVDGGYDDIIYWRIKIPIIPFVSERDYIFKRSMRKIDDSFIIYDVSVDHPDVPLNKKYVRIEEYERCMVARKSGDDIEVFVHYIKAVDLKMHIPNVLVNWAASSGFKSYFEKLMKSLSDYEEYLNENQDEE